MNLMLHFNIKNILTQEIQCGSKCTGNILDLDFVQRMCSSGIPLSRPKEKFVFFVMWIQDYSIITNLYNFDVEKFCDGKGIHYQRMHQVLTVIHSVSYC